MLTNKFVLAVAAGFLTIGLSACTALSEYGQSSYYNQSSSASKAENTVDAEDADGIITVSIENFAFVPAQLTVSPGDTIVFVNKDGAPHTATANGGAFDTGNLASGESGSITVTSAGTFDYFCAVHPAMKGSITVQE